MPQPPEGEPAGATVALPVLTAIAGGAARLTIEGEIVALSREAAAQLFKREAHLVCHTGFTARRLGLSEPGRRATGLPAHADVAELFAFVHPARPIIPSPAGLARALGLPMPVTADDAAETIAEAARRLLADLTRLPDRDRDEVRALVSAIAHSGWPWAPVIEALLGPAARRGVAFDTWRRLREWDEQRPRGRPGNQPVAESEARLWLAEILGPERERREAQFDYSGLGAEVFAPRARKGAGHVILAEAGTGIGKTLGYLSPATLWARRNDGAAWISTYTKNLQRQLDQELTRVFPDPLEKREKVAILKGRENYLCLLNYDEAAGGFALAPAREAAFLALVARWIPATRDGDIVGGDFPSWISAEYGGTGQLTDRRGECIYGACRHYRRCFIERNNRHAGQAEIVVANHALVMIRAAMNPREIDESGAPDDAAERAQPSRYVFDEGHHLFDAADGVFAAHLTVAEGAELRRWLRGRDAGRGRGGRHRGLRERIADGISGNDELETLVAAIERAAAALPGEGWLQRLRDGVPFGPFERFIAATRNQVIARTTEKASEYDLECEVDPPLEEVSATATALAVALAALAKPMNGLADAVAALLNDEKAEMDSGDAARLRAAARGLKRRSVYVVGAWMAMLERLRTGQAAEQMVDWFGIAREGGRERDAGYYRHHLDPSLPFAREVLDHVHGALITSATLRDRGAGDDEMADWRHAELRTGAQHLIEPAKRAAFGSPFDYGNQARVLVVTDVDVNEASDVARAYRTLFEASGGGALGLFTSVRRLRDIHKRIASKLQDANLALYAQHVDALDAGTLVDLFREEENASLLGTDAMRDGVDVPGRSLRLVVFDRLPWPRPDILHKARTKGLGIDKYNDVIVRMRLAQAFGRLIRRADDKGAFVILGAATPSRLIAGLPPGTQTQRVKLEDAREIVSAFVGPAATPGR
ncbi:MAG: ATP-dependent DNA helicase [Alphaproteobacteria bacterium]|nr:ATP-dependent DNA helicase [Alphaproteobacteria bacterium]